MSTSLAPVFGYLLPFLAIALVLALIMRELPMAEVAGKVARGEAVESEEELARLPTRADPTATVPVVDRDEDARETSVPA